MSYLAISIKEAINSINHNVNGWFLPAIQRPYVWGSRYENELYICKLFDSILKGYPIGGLIANAISNPPGSRACNEGGSCGVPGLIATAVASNGSVANINGISSGQMESGFTQSDVAFWAYTGTGVYEGKPKVADLRLIANLYPETIHVVARKDAGIKSVADLKGKRVLLNETGFTFVSKNVEIEWHCIRMNTLFSKLPEDDKRGFRKSIMARTSNISEQNEALIEDNIDALWGIFVGTEKKSLAYFPVKTNSVRVVNEVFERLNTGGMALSQADLLFSKIKADAYDFENRLISKNGNQARLVYDGDRSKQFVRCS